VRLGRSHDGRTGKEADKIFCKRVPGKPTNRFSKRIHSILDEVVRIVTRLNEPNALLAPEPLPAGKVDPPNFNFSLKRRRTQSHWLPTVTDLHSRWCSGVSTKAKGRETSGALM
jgi:hypothetical protein